MSLREIYNLEDTAEIDGETQKKCLAERLNRAMENLEPFLVSAFETSGPSKGRRGKFRTYSVDTKTLNGQNPFHVNFIFEWSEGKRKDFVLQGHISSQDPSQLVAFQGLKRESESFDLAVDFEDEENVKAFKGWIGSLLNEDCLCDFDY